MRNQLRMCAALLGLGFFASACGYSDAVVMGSSVIVLRNGFFGATRTINQCHVTDAGLNNCKQAENGEETVGSPGATSTATPPSTPPPAQSEPAKAIDDVGAGVTKAASGAEPAAKAKAADDAKAKADAKTKAKKAPAKKKKK